MKTKQTLRQEAVQRLAKSTYEDSRAKRLGTRSEQQWNEWKNKELARLSARV